MELHNENAVSPVVGVMLMLVVVIIIAAVVSGFAGGLIGSNNQKTPQLAMDAQIVNTGYWSSSYFKAQVTGVDKPVATKDLKIVSSWSKTLINGTTVKGGATMVPGVLNYHVYSKANGKSAWDNWTNVCPQGYGAGVGNGTAITYYISPYEWIGDRANPPSGATMADVWSGKYTNFTWFGNYDLQAGTTMFARPFGGYMFGGSTGGSSLTVGYGVAPNATAGNTGGGRYQYAYGYDSRQADFKQYPESVDQMQAVLGNNWNLLMAGDTVTMKVIHTPTGKTIWQKDIVVEG